VTADVAACYPSIGTDAVGRALTSSGADHTSVASLVRLLAEIARGGTPGLPVGPEPSALLANAVLGLADRAAVDAGARVLRWVDDVVLTAPDRTSVVRAFDAWVRALALVGLRPNDAKVVIWPTAENAAVMLGATRPSEASRSRGLSVR
jgi:hypothetical protein